MTSIRNNEYRCECPCGYQSHEFSELYSEGIVASGPFNYRFREEYTGLRLVTKNVICKNCGTLHERCNAIADTGYWQYPIAIGGMAVAGILTSQWLSGIAWVATTFAFAVLLIVGVRILKRRKSNRIMKQYPDWIAEIDEAKHYCPKCQSTEYISPIALPNYLPCPACGECNQLVVQTYKVKLFGS